MTKKVYSEHELIEKAGGRFKLTSLLEKRYRELVFGSRPLVDVDSEDPLDILLAEVGEGKIELVPESEAVAAAAAALMGDGVPEKTAEPESAEQAPEKGAAGEEEDMAGYFERPTLASPEDIRDSEKVPEGPGIYAWYSDEIPPRVPTEGCLTVGKATLLYVGKAVKEGLRTRILDIDYGLAAAGNAYGSTLRKSLGCLLRKKLRLKPEGSARRWTFGKGEEKLSKWMTEHARVAWVPLEDRQFPWNRGKSEDDAEVLTRIEKHLISEYSLPLNIVYNSRHPFCAELKTLRKECGPEE